MPRDILDHKFECSSRSSKNQICWKFFNNQKFSFFFVFQNANNVLQVSMSSDLTSSIQVPIATKKCTGCRLPPQPVTEFVGDNGKETKQCQRCRNKAKRTQQRPEAKAAKAQCNQRNRSSYDKVYKERQTRTPDQLAEFRKRHAEIQANYLKRKKEMQEFHGNSMTDQK
jgi:hypothetical protein